MEDTLIAVVLFGGIFTVIGIGVVYRHRTRLAQQDTIRKAIEAGQELSPELLKSIANTTPKDRDLRRGLVSLAIAAGFVSLAFAVPDEEALSVMFGVAGFPAFIGLAFLAMHFFGSKED